MAYLEDHASRWMRAQTPCRCRGRLPAVQAAIPGHRPGATSKELLVRDEDVQVLHGFETAADAKAYLASELFTRDVVGGLAPLLSAAPDVRVYERRPNLRRHNSEQPSHDGPADPFLAGRSKTITSTATA